VTRGVGAPCPLSTFVSGRFCRGKGVGSFDLRPHAAYRQDVGSTGLIVPFGRYVLKERLAQGGMGEVFRAVAVGEHGFEKPVVVKRVLPSHAGRDDLADLFVAEAKLMTRLAHPNIVGVLDFGRGEHDDYYLVLELVEGADLGRLLRAFAARGEPFPVPLALFVASQVLRGLHHAHTKSASEGGFVVHRDVSPSNVLCSAEGEVKVADFGVALVTHVGGEGGAGVAGKPGYMAPEQFDGGAVDPRADVFSAGVVLYQMLTGELPFQGETVEAQQAATRRGERQPARARRAETSEAVEAILERALAPSPEARFQDAKAMAQAIEGLRDQGQRLATGDDLADVVRAAQRALPAPGRKVIALSTAAPSGPDSGDAPSELTRTAAPGGVGAFTLRFPVRADATTRQQGSAGDAASRAPDRWSKPEPRTERIAPDEPSPGSSPPSGVATGLRAPEGAPEEGGEPAELPLDGPRQRSIRLGAIAAVVAAALLGVIAFFPRAPSSAAPTVPLAAPSSATPAAPPEARAPPVVSVSAPPEPAVTAAPAPHASSRAAVPRGPASAAPPAVAATATATATAAAAPPEDCSGDVAVFSEGAWVVSGGPRVVESPTTVTWPCGTYALSARSRLDPGQVKTTTLTVGPKRRAVFELR
jgi:eukaryotic-like serine/threonine-protein kinase